MNKLSYKTKLLLIYIISASLVGYLIFNLFNNFKSSDVGLISKEHLEQTALEKELDIENFFTPYTSTLRTVQQSNILQEYFINNIKKNTLENYFVDIKKSLPFLTQISFLDNNGNEKIKISGTTLALDKNQTNIKIVSNDKLKNISKVPFIQNFMNLKPNTIGLSNIELNKEFEKITLPKEPIIKIGGKVYDKNQNFKGIVVFKINLEMFFKTLNQTTLYYTHLIDKDGKYIVYHNNKYGLIGENPEYNIANEFPMQVKNILENNRFFTDTFYVHTISNLNNNQNLKLVLELRYKQEIELREEAQHNFTIISLVLSVVFLIVVLYFSFLPDNIESKAKKEKLLSRLTNTPNRIALMEDIVNKEFSNSIIILVSVNNILKIQNTYGYHISNELVKQFSHFLKSYNNDLVKKIYTNSYNVFTIKYPFRDEKSEKEFLEQLIVDIEHQTFKVFIDNDEMDFSLDVTIGVSSMNTHTNAMEKLNEAENALDYALEKHMQLQIYNSSFQENIKENKNNIILAQQIKKAIDENSISLVYQPIYNNFTEKIEKYESLIRMQCNGKTIYPDQFLPIAKQINQYNTLSKIVVEKSFAYFCDKDFEFSINLSILDIEDLGFQNYLFEKIEEYQVQNKLVLEIVEQEDVKTYDEFFEFLKKVKKLGCKIAIDDFGSGYSNFQYIINMSGYIDYLKLDGSLVTKIVEEPKNQILIGSLKFLCDNLNIKTIAEYVENEEILRYLYSIGIEYSQGYFIGKPDIQLSNK